jgi:hypothetical protein
VGDVAMKKIMIFIEGTTFYTKPFLYLFSKRGYVPLGNSVKIVNDLFDQGNEIYLCSYVRKDRYRFIKSVMDHYKVKYTQILCRDKGEQYSDLVERVIPDILIEDDCASIGGEKEWCITNVREDIKKNIKSFIVEEFKGIDHIEKEIMSE